MSFNINLGEYGADLEKEYQKVLSSDPGTTWTVFSYDDSGNALKPHDSGSGDLDEFVESFDDALISYGLARVEFNGINKIVLVGFVGDNVSGRKRLTFNSHMAAVAKEFSGHHIQITALGVDELSPEIIMDRVSAAAGSKYSASTKKTPATKPKYVQAQDGANEDDWGSTKPVSERELSSGAKSGYSSSARDELNAFRNKSGPTPKKAPQKATPEPESEPEEEPEEEEEEEEEVKPKRASAKDDSEDDKPKSIAGLDSGTSYKPIGKIDIKAIRAEAKGSKFADARVEKIESSYKPVGKVDLKAIREQARKEKQLKASRMEDDEPPKSLPKREPLRSTPKEDSDEEEPPKKSSSSSSSKTSSNAVESDYQPPNRRAEYGVKAAGKSKPVGVLGDDDEPQFGSLADRMKAFQSSVSGAKPKFEPKSRLASSAPKSAAKSASPAPKASPASSSSAASDDEDSAPISVAAQLARSRLAAKNDDDESESVEELRKARQASYGVGKKTETPKQPSSATSAASSAASGAEPSSKASTFAARFAKKEAEKSDDDAKDDGNSDDEFDAPPPPRRAGGPPPAPAAASTPAPSAPPSAPAALPARKSQPEEEEEKEEEEEEDEESGFSGKVIEAYEKDDEDEIELKVGDIITDIHEADENWWIGKNSKGDVGMFPADYVKKIPAGSSGASSASSAAPAPIPPRKAASPESESSDNDPPESDEKVAVALYSHELEEGDEDEIAFEEGEDVVVLDFTSDDWWTGRNLKGEVGLFPANYVKLK